MKFIDSILKYIEGLFEEHAPKIVAAASTPAAQAITAAAVTAAIQQAEQNPKVQAGIAVYQAVKNYNAVASVTATAPQAPSTPPAALKEL